MRTTSFGAHLCWELDSTAETLGQVQVALVGSSLDGVVEVGNIGGRRHVNLVLVGKVPVCQRKVLFTPHSNLLLEGRSGDTDSGLFRVSLDSFLKRISFARRLSRRGDVVWSCQKR